MLLIPGLNEYNVKYSAVPIASWKSSFLIRVASWYGGPPRMLGEYLWVLPCHDVKIMIGDFNSGMGKGTLWEHLKHPTYSCEIINWFSTVTKEDLIRWEMSCRGMCENDCVSQKVARNEKGEPKSSIDKEWYQYPFHT